MYNLYKDICKASSQEHVKESMYRKIFNTHFNLSFNRPRGKILAENVNALRSEFTLLKT